MCKFYWIGLYLHCHVQTGMFQADMIDVHNPITWHKAAVNLKQVQQDLF